MSNKKYNGPFKNEISSYLEYRIKQKLKPYPASSYLHDFDKYTIKNKITKLTRENVEDWLTLKNNEKLNTLKTRAGIIKSFCKYLNLIGIEAYIIDSKIYACKSSYIPHIYTGDEIKIFFKQIEKTVKTSKSFPNNKEQIKLFFKILYCCGMRKSELLNLKIDNINLEEKFILIKNSKNNIDRLVYFNEDIFNDISLYLKKRHNKISKYLFYNTKTNNRRSTTSIYIIFCKIIKNSKFNNNIRYRIHDFRHTFAVTNIKLSYLKNKDIYAFLPILMNYMGHSDIKSTEYYLRFTPDLFEHVTNQIKKEFDVIPKLEEISYE